MDIAALFALLLLVSPTGEELSMASSIASASPRGSDLIELAGAAFTLQPTATLDFNSSHQSTSESPQNSAAEIPLATMPVREPFGMTGSTYWTVNAGGASDLEDSHIARVGGGISHFIADDISFDVQLDLGYYAEEGDGAFGVNLSFLMRWHFFMSDDRSWSLYADGGAGFLGTTLDVPKTGSRFNFTPQAGLGVSFDVAQVSRLYIGARWLHISNARIYEENPGEDYGMVYAMLSWPF